MNCVLVLVGEAEAFLKMRALGMTYECLEGLIDRAALTLCHPACIREKG